MVDAYQDITIPFQMSSVEFFTLVSDHLKENGVMVVNMNMRGSGSHGINEWLADTISAVFPEVYTVDVAFSSNRELFASHNTEMISRFKDQLAKETDNDLIYAISTVDRKLERYNPGTDIMTDDKAPVELLGMRVIDELIGEEVDYYKGLIKGKSLREIMELLN